MAGITREQVTKLHKENERNRLLDEMLQVLAEKKTSDDIQRQQMAIYKEFGEELHAQFDAYFAGPKGSTVKYASSAFLNMVLDGVRNTFFAVCCEMVLAPLTLFPLFLSFTAFRISTISKPL